jgi:uncharacterized protein
MRPSLRLADSRVLLTGATGGIGRAIGRALHERRAQLLLSSRSGDALAAICAELGERAEALPADLSWPGAAVALAAAAGPVDVLVANAALPSSGSLLEYDLDAIDRSLEVNLRAPIQLTRALLPGMLERGRGQLVYIDSISGKLATVGTALYSASKFGLRGFSAALRHDLHGTPVGVTTIFPSFVAEAGFFADTGVELPRWVATRTPDDVASAVVRGIERNRTEIDVAPLSLRVGVLASALVPGLSAAVQRRLGSRELAGRIARAQASKR